MNYDDEDIHDNKNIYGEEKINEIIFNDFYPITDDWMTAFGRIEDDKVCVYDTRPTFRCVGFYDLDGEAKAVLRNMAGNQGGGTEKIRAFQLFSVGGYGISESKIEIPNGYALNSEYISNSDYYINYDLSLDSVASDRKPLLAKGTTVLLKGTLIINNVMLAVLQLHKPYHGTNKLLKEKYLMTLQFNEQHPAPFCEWTEKKEK